MIGPTLPPNDTRFSIALVFEQHLGHRTFGENLRAAASADGSLRVEWVPIEYDWRRANRLSRITDLGGRGGTLAGRQEVRRGLVAHDVDVWIYNTQVPAALAGRKIKRPYVVITDVTPCQYDAMAEGYGHRADHGGPLASWKDRVNRRVFANAELCIGWSSWAAGSLAAEYGVPADRIAVIPPGVDLGQWQPVSRPDDGTVRILFVGGEFERKGGDLLLDACSRLPDHVELDLVTHAAVPPTDRVRVVNDLQPNDPRLLELYRCADVFALPSRAETFGIAAVEACASGLPVVASGVGGLTDIVIDGATGLVVPPGDADALTERLGRLVDDVELRRRLGDAAREHAVKHFDAARNADRLFELVRERVLARS
jgi:glycosyltransferase involved in cell wall biosynthesis